MISQVSTLAEHNHLHFFEYHTGSPLPFVLFFPLLFEFETVFFNGQVHAARVYVEISCVEAWLVLTAFVFFILTALRRFLLSRATHARLRSLGVLILVAFAFLITFFCLRAQLDFVLLENVILFVLRPFSLLVDAIFVFVDCIWEQLQA